MTLQCQRDSCKSFRIVTIEARCKDMCTVVMDFDDLVKEVTSYPPSDMGFSSNGDSVEISYCLDCGQVHGSNWPLPETYFEKPAEDSEYEENK